MNTPPANRRVIGGYTIPFEDGFVESDELFHSRAMADWIEFLLAHDAHEVDGICFTGNRYMGAFFRIIAGGREGTLVSLAGRMGAHDVAVSSRRNLSRSGGGRRALGHIETREWISGKRNLDSRLNSASTGAAVSARTRGRWFLLNLIAADSYSDADLYQIAACSVPFRAVAEMALEGLAASTIISYESVPEVWLNGVLEGLL